MKKRINHKIRYSEKDYVQKNYMKDGKAVIPIKINKLDDLYMKHDYLKLDLSDAVSDYIEEIAYLIPQRTDIVLEIHYNEEISNNQQSRIRKVFKANYGSDIDDIDYALRKHNYRCIAMFLLGIIFTFLYFVLLSFSHYISDFIAELCIITGWVFLWDMVETVSIKRADLMYKRLNKLQLYDAEITFVLDE